MQYLPSDGFPRVRVPALENLLEGTAAEESVQVLREEIPVRSGLWERLRALRSLRSFCIGNARKKGKCLVEGKGNRPFYCFLYVYVKKEIGRF